MFLFCSILFTRSLKPSGVCPMLERHFKLRPEGLDCDVNGLRFCGEPLLALRSVGGGVRKWAPLGKQEIQRVVSRAYGTPVDADRKLLGLETVAQALNRGEIARAQIAALFLHLPNPVLWKSASDRVDVLRNELAQCGWLRKDWEEDDHPRTGVPPNPGRFAPKDGDQTPGSQADSTPRSAESDRHGKRRASRRYDDEFQLCLPMLAIRQECSIIITS